MNNRHITCGLLAGFTLGIAGGVLFAQIPTVLVETAQPPGAPKSAETKALEVGANLLQNDSPLSAINIYLVGFHPLKDHPSRQMEAHHYCHQVNEDFAQCVLFDGNSKDANLSGIEYIISESLFDSLPESEKSYWHPHNGEILSGQLVAPGMPQGAEKVLMKKKLNSYGKTWHVWNTGMASMQADRLPLGTPELAWSFNRDGEAITGLIEQRDRRLRMSTIDKRKDREDLQPLAKPQAGIDQLKQSFTRSGTPIAGVVDKREVGLR